MHFREQLTHNSVTAASGVSMLNYDEAEAEAGMPERDRRPKARAQRGSNQNRRASPMRETTRSAATGSRTAHFSGSQARQTHRKSLQVAGQAARTLNLFLGGCSDEVLSGLRVVTVLPAPDSRHLLVTLQRGLAVPRSAEPIILGRLAQLRGRLRAELAHDISRRKAPDFTFRFASDPEAISELRPQPNKPARLESRDSARPGSAASADD